MLILPILTLNLWFLWIDNCSTTIIILTIFLFLKVPIIWFSVTGNEKGVRWCQTWFGFRSKTLPHLRVSIELKIELTVMIFVVELNFIPTEVSMSSIEFYIWSIHKCLFKITHRNYCRIQEKYHVSDPI